MFTLLFTGDSIKLPTGLVANLKGAESSVRGGGGGKEKKKRGKIGKSNCRDLPLPEQAVGKCQQPYNSITPLNQG